MRIYRCVPDTYTGFNCEFLKVYDGEYKNRGQPVDMPYKNTTTAIQLRIELDSHDIFFFFTTRVVDFLDVLVG